MILKVFLFLIWLLIKDLHKVILGSIVRIKDFIDFGGFLVFDMVFRREFI